MHLLCSRWKEDFYVERRRRHRTCTAGVGRREARGVVKSGMAAGLTMNLALTPFSRYHVLPGHRVEDNERRDLANVAECGFQDSFK